jgi:hypothetical protein
MTNQLPRQLDETVSLGIGGRLRVLWDQIHAALQDMSYASRRIVELQAPWIVDDQSR